MAGNQREMERREKREKKDRRNKAIVWSIIAVIVVILAVMKIFEINVNDVKDRFTDENGNFTLTEGVESSNFPYSIDASQNVKLVNINNKIGVLTPNSFTVLDGKEATADYLFEHGYSNPVLKTAGVYSLVYDQGDNSYRLDTTSEAVYEEELDKSIFCADVAKNGTVAVATSSKEKLCDITVISTSLEKKLEKSISYGYAVDIALNSGGKQVAVATVSSVNAALATTVYIYDVNSGEEFSVALPQGSLAGLRYDGNNIWAVGDTYLGVIKNNKYNPVYEQGTINTECFDFSGSGDLIIAYGGYSNSAEHTIACVKSSGKIKNEFKTDGGTKDICATDSLVSVLTADEIVSYNIKNGEEKEKIAVPDSVKSICRLGSSVFIHRQSVVDKGVASND